MRTLRSTPLLLALGAAAVLLAGCGTMGDIFDGRDRGPYGGPYGQDDYGDVRGTVARVDLAERAIVIDREGNDRYDLRNGDGDRLVLYYDDRTTVEHQGRTYRPQDLEPGDRVQAAVGRSGDRLFAEEIQVLYDVSGGIGNDDDLGRRDLRGTVRYVDTRDRTLEIDTGGYGYGFSTSDRRSGDADDVVVVDYDASTVVEYQGRRYEPENLERGDEVEIDLRDLGERRLAERIVVVGEGRSLGR